MVSGVRIGVSALLVAASALPAAAGAASLNDPLFHQQWALARESALGRAAAWQQSTGAGALVAVLDTGADLSHPDLAGAFWTNPGEIPGNGKDDDHDGFVDDVHGADIVNHDGDPSDDEGHGTHVAGIIAAHLGNAEGGTGLAPAARLMIVKVLDEHRAGTEDGLAEGIRYAVAHGARVINTSVNGDSQSRALQDAIRAAGAAGALVIASAGNDGRNIDLVPSYPASNPDPAIVSVAAVGQDGDLSQFSNRGVVGVDIAAPGEGIVSTASDGGYELRSGTSMAAPFVSATLALILSARPELDAAALKSALLTGASHSAGLAGQLVTGALNAAGSLRAVLGDAGWRGASDPLVVRTLRAARARRGARVRWTIGGDAAAVAEVVVSVDGHRVALRHSPAAGSKRVRARSGKHGWDVVARDSAGTLLGRAVGTFSVPRAAWKTRRRG